MRAVVVAIVLLSGLACGSEDDPADCLTSGGDTICFEGNTGDTATCEQIGANTFMCGASQVTTNFGAPGEPVLRSEAAIIWKPRRVEMPAKIDRRFCDPTGHVCVECATCDGAVNACVECASEGRAFRTDPIEPSKE